MINLLNDKIKMERIYMKSKKELIQELDGNINWSELETTVSDLGLQWVHPYLDNYYPSEHELRMKVAELAEQVLNTGEKFVRQGNLQVMNEGDHLEFEFVHSFRIE